MNTVEDQLATYFDWLDAELGDSERHQAGRDASSRQHPSGWARLAVAAAAAVVLVTGLAAIARRSGDTDAPAVASVPTDTPAWKAGWLTIDLPGAVRIRQQTDDEVMGDGSATSYLVWADLAGDPIRVMSLAQLRERAPMVRPPGTDGAVITPEGPELSGAPDGVAWVEDVGGTRYLRWERPDGSTVSVRGTGVTTEQLAQWMFTLGIEGLDAPEHPDPAMRPLMVNLADTRPRHYEDWELDGATIEARAIPSFFGIALSQGYESIQHADIDGTQGYIGRWADKTALIWPIDDTYTAWVEIPGEITRPLGEIIAGIHVVRSTPPTTDTVPRGTTVPPGTVPTVTTTEAATVTLPMPPPATAPNDDASQRGLTTILDGEGVDLAAATEAGVFTGVEGAETCGIDHSEIGGALVTNPTARRCFLDRHLVGAPAVLVTTGSTNEGAPVVVVWHAQADGTLTMFVDSTRDPLGSGEWERRECPTLTTRPSGTAGQVPPTYFVCSVEGEPSAAAATELPGWFQGLRAIDAEADTEVCGYFRGGTDDLTPGWDCLRTAVAEGRSAEVVVMVDPVRGDVWWLRYVADADLYQLVEWSNRPGGGGGWRLTAECAVDLAELPVGPHVGTSPTGVVSMNGVDCHADPTGTIRGALRTSGGPAPSIVANAPGTVHLRQALPSGGPGSPWLATADLTTFDDGTFELELPPGTYQVWGSISAFQAGGLQCPPDGTTVTVRTGATSALELDCPMK